MRLDAGIVIPGRGEPIPDGAVVVEGGRISYVGPASAAPEEATGAYPALMPGMWDVHAHFLGVPSPFLQDAVRTHDAVKAARGTADVAEALMAGVTSVRELGGLGIYLRTAIDEGRIAGPNIYGAGDALSTTGGHGDIHGFPLEWMESGHGYLFSEMCDGVPECLKAVRKQLRKGVDVIKICASGGVASEIDHPIHQQFSLEELRAIVEEAGRAERVVAAHCHGKPGIMAALEAGVKTIEHGSYLDEEAATAMVESDAILVPTRFIIEEGLAQEEAWPPYAYKKMVMISDHHANAVKTAIARGVTIAAGSDAIVTGTGARRTAEVRLLIEAGMTPLEAIEAATATGPLTLGPQAPRKGLLAEGYDADIIALDTNPGTDITVWGDPDRVTHVWKDGVPVKGL
jgi:imidazolonepropionase-like amidohydrolase